MSVGRPGEGGADPVLAVILAGGASRRMGRPKAWLEVGGRSCIARVWDACRSAGLEVEFQGTLAGLREAFPETGIHPDREPGQGPLAALAAALVRHPGRAVLLVACDMPFVSAGFLLGVTAGLETADWSVPCDAAGMHPLCAAYAPTTLPAAEALLARGRRDMHALLAHPGLRGCRVAPRPEWGDPRALLCNLNTPADLEDARCLAGRRAPRTAGR